MTGNSDVQTGSLITLDRQRYEELLIELGELRKQSQFLLEYKAELKAKDRELKEKEKELEEIKEILLETEWKDYELEQTQKRLRELEIEVAQLRSKRSWWHKLWSESC